MAAGYFSGGAVDRMHGRKTLVWLVLAAAAGAVAGGIWWSAAHEPPPQVITLPSGVQYRFVGVTYGTNNVPPSLLAKAVHWLPKPLADRVRTYAGGRISQVNEAEVFDSPHLFVWLKRVGTGGIQAGGITSRGIYSYEAVLADDAGIAGREQTIEYFFADNVTWASVPFGVVPKRSKVLECRLNFGSSSPGSATQFDKIRFSNPVYGHYPKWKPEPVPILKGSGDLEVRLDGVQTGNLRNAETVGRTLVRRHASHSGSTARTGSAGLQFNYAVRSRRGTNEWWILEDAELSDATGNSLMGDAQFAYLGPSNTNPPIGGTWCSYSRSMETTLWPDETAWRLTLEFKRSYGLDPNEMVTFTNIPIPGMGMTNTSVFTNQVNRHRLSSRILHSMLISRTTGRTCIPFRGTGRSFWRLRKALRTVVETKKVWPWISCRR